MFIELSEYHYMNGGYYTEPFLLNINEISTVQEEWGRSSYVECRTVVMKNNKIHKVKETYKEIVDKTMKVLGKDK